MEIFRKKIVAVPIALVVVLLSTIFSVNRTLGAACQEVEAGFHSGVVYEGYKRPSIESHLDLRLNRAATIISIAVNYDELQDHTDYIRNTREALLHALERGSVRSCYTANEMLQEAVTGWALAAEDTMFTEREAMILDTCLSDFTESARAITESGYNESVMEFIRTTYDVFPTRILAAISGVDAPEYFDHMNQELS
ncbi:MAG: hypothetical protein Q4A39_04175 [Eubacteriales bacterium]|nr:hypothetical protein [Eubacteriales bacterium]